jgi:hypothetical protein
VTGHHARKDIGRMIDQSPHPTDSHRGLRLLALAAVAVGVLLLAAAAFVLSYAGIHVVALAAGVSPRLARIYPLIFDAMLVVACAAVLSLRGAGLPSRAYAWLSMLVLVAGAAAADAVHATGTRLPHRPAAAAAAVIPWVLVLVGFGLLLCMLRQARLRRAAAPPAADAARRDVVPEPSGHVAVRPGNGRLSGPGTYSGEGAAQRVPDRAGIAADLASDLAIDAEPGQDDPARDEAGLAEQPEIARVPRARQEQTAGYGGRPGDRSASAFSSAPTVALASDAGTEDATHSTAASAESGLGADGADGSDLGPGPEAETRSESDAEADLETEARPEAEADLETEAGPEPEADLETEAGPEPEADLETEAGPEAGAGSEAEPVGAAEPVPAAPQFNRKRSSPVPPEA